MHNPNLKNHVSLQKLIETLGNQPNFAMVQFPLNMFEKNAAKRFHDKSSLIEFAADQGLYLLAHRPLNAIHESSIKSLVTDNSMPGLFLFAFNLFSEESFVSEQLLNAFSKAIEMEIQLTTLVHTMASTETLSKFIWAQAVSENLGKLASDPFVTEYYFSRTVLPELEQDLAHLEKEDSSLQHWCREYRESVLLLKTFVVQMAKLAVQKSNQELFKLITTFSHDGFLQDYNGSLTKVALKYAASEVGSNGSVLNGMRQSKYVDEAEEVLQLPEFQQHHLESFRNSHFL